MTAKASPHPEKPAAGKPASMSLKPMAFVVPVFVVMASLTMQASNGFLHAIFGGGPASPLRPLDTFNGLLISTIGHTPSIMIYGALTGILSGLTYWIAAQKPKSLMAKAASEPDKRKARRPAFKTRKPEQAIIDPNRVAKVMGLSTRAANPEDGQFTA